jgi:hypothetical protein
MWTTKNPHCCDRDKLRYPSDLTDAESVLAKPSHAQSCSCAGNLASIAASRRLVFTRSPASFGISDGATTVQSCPSPLNSR